MKKIFLLVGLCAFFGLLLSSAQAWPPWRPKPPTPDEKRFQHFKMEAEIGRRMCGKDSACWERYRKCNADKHCRRQCLGPGGMGNSCIKRYLLVQAGLEAKAREEVEMFRAAAWAVIRGTEAQACGGDLKCLEELNEAFIRECGKDGNCLAGVVDQTCRPRRPHEAVPLWHEARGEDSNLLNPLKLPEEYRKARAACGEDKKCLESVKLKNLEEYRKARARRGEDLKRHREKELKCVEFFHPRVLLACGEDSTCLARVRRGKTMVRYWIWDAAREAKVREVKVQEVERKAQECGEDRECREAIIKASGMYAVRWLVDWRDTAREAERKARECGEDATCRAAVAQECGENGLCLGGVARACGGDSTCRATLLQACRGDLGCQRFFVQACGEDLRCRARVVLACGQDRKCCKAAWPPEPSYLRGIPAPAI